MNVKKSIYRTLVATVALAFSSATTLADTITVCADGCDYTSINAAIGAASDGDVIQLAAETYFEGVQIDTVGKMITLRGVLDKAGEPATMLDGAGSHRVLMVRFGEGAATVFENLVIQNGYSTDYGGGMYSTLSSPTLRNCIFDDNIAAVSGGGMYVYSSSPILTGCAFTDNSSFWGGGAMFNEGDSTPTLTGCVFTRNLNRAMYNYSCSPILVDCAFENNPDGGMYNYDGSNTILTGCTFGSNSSSNAGGGMINNDNSNPTLTDCTFAANSAMSGAGMWNGDSSSPTLIGCEFIGNSAIYDGGGIENSSSSTATLIDCTLCGNSPDQIFGSWNDDGSNCVVTSCDDCEPPSDGCPGDLDQNGEVDASDLGLLISAWDTDGSIIKGSDINGDGIVSAADLGLLIGAWGPCQ